ncbi:MAG: hypothetical protein ACE5HO_19185 [bacterium]
MRRVEIAILCLSVLCGCRSPFSTRTPEPPDQNSSNFIPPSIPEIVFVNLQVAVGEKNVENYMLSFVDTTRSQQRFVFLPDQGVAATQPGTFTGWNLEDERQYLNRVFQATPTDSAHSLSFAEENRVEGATTATFTQNYTIVLRHTRQSDNIPVLYRGQSKFWLEKDDTGNWAIYRWEDFNNDFDASWSELKAFFQ